MTSPKADPFNICDWLVDRHVRDGLGLRPALRAGGRSVTYEGLLEMAELAGGALAGMGVRPEERVLLVMLDSVEFVAAFLGATRIGAIPAPINPLLPAADVAAVAADARARVAVVSGERVALVTDLTAGTTELRDVMITGEEAMPAPPKVATHAWTDALAGASRAAPAATNEDSPGFWLCTSGTTGQPKLAMHRHADLRLVSETYATEVLAIGGDDRLYSAAPMFHAYGLGNSLAFPLAAGATAILERVRPPTPDMIARVVREERPSLFFAVPTTYAALLAGGLPEDTFRSVRLAVSAGEALPADLFERFRDRFGVEVLDGIGSTEMSHIFISNRAGHVVAGTSGTPVDGYEARLVAEDGGEVTAGSPGQLWVRGQSAATGYWCRTEASRRTFAGEWVRTGDMYSRSAAGVFTYVGRTDDLFKVGGEWVSPYEVESVLVRHPDVLEAAVVAGPTADGLLQGIAFVVPTQGTRPDEAALHEFCRPQLAGFKRPKQINIVEKLPKTATGKIRRNVLRDMVGAVRTQS